MERAHADRRAWIVLALLLTTGWSANHFAAVIPVLREREGLSPDLLAGVYGLYAVGLLPGLLAGGTLSDRVGRARVALPGALLAIVGSLLLAVWHDAAGLAVGRIVVGMGAGAAFSAGTAWSADLTGAPGAVRAGVALTSGFALGAVVSGFVGSWLPAPLVLPFLLSALLSGLALVAAALMVREPRRRTSTAAPGGREPTAESLAPADAAPAPPAAAGDPDGGSVGRALGWALPIAPWVFVSTVGIVTVPARLDLTAIDAPIVAGMAAGVALGAGLLAQAYARRRDLGPASGALGAVLVGAALLVVAAGGAAPAAIVGALAILLFGVGYGLCLRAGLLDLQVHAPPARRGLVTGVFYVTTYLGFATPFAFEALSGPVGIVWPPAVLGGVALLMGLQRVVRLRRRAGAPVAA